MSLNHAALADELHRARVARTEVRALTDRGPLSSGDAYRIQALGVQLREADGETIVGGKLGFTSEAMRRAMGVDEPNYGWLTDAMSVTDGVIGPEDFIHPKVEPEIAFLLDADLGPDATAEDVLEATGGVCASLEIVDSRYRDFVFRAPDNIADDSSAAGFVLGTSLVRPPAGGLAGVGVVMTVDGEVAATAAGAAVMPDPASAVAWMARAVHAAGGRGLRGGDVVLSGGLTAPVTLEPGMTVTVEIDRIGSASLRVRSAEGVLAMAIVQIELLAGRDMEKKHRLIRLVTDAVCEALGTRPESVRVILREMDPDHYGIAGVPASERESQPAGR